MQIPSIVHASSYNMVLPVSKSIPNYSPLKMSGSVDKLLFDSSIGITGCNTFQQMITHPAGCGCSLRVILSTP